MNPAALSRRWITAVWLVLSLGLAAVIGVLTLMPVAFVPEGPRGVDKLYHALAFAALVFPTASLRPRLLWAVAPLALLYGAAIEIIQPHVGRSGEVADLIADGLGVAIGIGLGLLVRRLLSWRARRLT